MKGRGATYLPRGAPLLTGALRLKLRFTLVAPQVYVCAEFCQPQIGFFANAVADASSSVALATGLEEQRRGGRGDVERLDLTDLGQRDEAIAGGGNAGP